jgi:TRAP-type mannitol/chloroaromatic compound transport system substrate-binding protein
MVPWLVTAQPGLATEATPVPAAVTVAPLTTVALVMPGAVAQPATPRTMAPFAPGRIKIEVFPAGAFVRPFESFDAVGAGVADMCHSTGNYWETKSPAFTFFAAMPFGFTADERALQ